MVEDKIFLSVYLSTRRYCGVNRFQPLSIAEVHMSENTLSLMMLRHVRIGWELAN
jgi:hypothetical protein